MRGARIEISGDTPRTCRICRSPGGERGLKSMRGLPRLYVVGRSLCGERGLKYLCHLTGLLCLLSLPMWGEMCTSLAKTKPVRSLPMRGARIEIPCIPWCRCSEVVAPRTGSVDQNTRKLSSDHHRECIGMADGASLVLFLI